MNSIKYTLNKVFLRIKLAVKKFWRTAE